MLGAVNPDPIAVPGALAGAEVKVGTRIGVYYMEYRDTMDETQPFQIRRTSSLDVRRSGRLTVSVPCQHTSTDD